MEPKLKPDNVPDNELTPEKMRELICRHADFNPLIHRVMRVGKIHSWSESDIFAVLAFHALVSLEESRERELKRLSETSPQWRLARKGKRI